MKRLCVLALGTMLVGFALTAPAETNPADQKWLEAVQKMVVKGERKVSTPNEERVNLLKTWGKEHGYAVKVTKNVSGYTVEVTKDLAQR